MNNLNFIEADQIENISSNQESSLLNSLRKGVAVMAMGAAVIGCKNNNVNKYGPPDLPEKEEIKLIYLPKRFEVVEKISNYEWYVRDPKTEICYFHSNVFEFLTYVPCEKLKQNKETVSDEKKE